MSEQIHPFVDESSYGTPLTDAEEKKAWITFAALVAILAYGYGNMLSYLTKYWEMPLYSHGFLVPIFTGYLLWVRRRKLTRVSPKERWMGLGVLVLCLLIRLAASSIDMNPIDRLSFIGSLCGISIMIGGTAMLRWAGLPFVFLAFMYPLPKILEDNVLTTLQTVAAKASTWVLQLIGVAALRDGNRIIIDQLSEPLEVADACSGLRMSTIFGAMSVAMAMLINRPWWDRLTILLSAIPVALATNVIRITLTALLYMSFPESEAIKHYVHDWAGLAMMPIAMGLLWVELEILNRITVPIETEDYAAFGAAHG